MREFIQKIQALRCNNCPGNCEVDRTIDLIDSEQLSGQSHNLLPVALERIAHNSGLVGKVRTTKDNGSAINITHQIENTSPCVSRVVVHTKRSC